MLWCSSEMPECCEEMHGFSRKMPSGDSWAPTLMLFSSREVLGCSWEMIWCHGGCSRKMLVLPAKILAFNREVLVFSREVP